MRDLDRIPEDICRLLDALDREQALAEHFVVHKDAHHRTPVRLLPLDDFSDRQVLEWVRFLAGSPFPGTCCALSHRFLTSSPLLVFWGPSETAVALHREVLARVLAASGVFFVPTYVGERPAGDPCERGAAVSAFVPTPGITLSPGMESLLSGLQGFEDAPAPALADHDKPPSLLSAYIREERRLRILEAVHRRLSRADPATSRTLAKITRPTLLQDDFAESVLEFEGSYPRRPGHYGLMAELFSYTRTQMAPNPPEAIG